jgi:hypothetical protein
MLSPFNHPFHPLPTTLHVLTVVSALFTYQIRVDSSEKTPSRERRDLSRMAGANAAYGSGRIRERGDDREQDVETMGLQRVLSIFLAPVHGCHDPG